MDTFTVTLRHPDCPAASRPQLREGLSGSQTRGRRERKPEEERAVIDRHQNLCNTSSSVTLVSPYKWHSSLHKHFEIVLTDDHICFVSVILFLFLPMTHRRVYFLYEYIFYSRFFFFFHGKDIERLSCVIG